MKSTQSIAGGTDLSVESVVGGCISCVLLGEYIREYMKERIDRNVERMSWKKILFCTENWEELGSFGWTHIICPCPLT
jgi:hypothetical protein